MFRHASGRNRSAAARPVFRTPLPDAAHIERARRLQFSPQTRYNVVRDAKADRRCGVRTDLDDRCRAGAIKTGAASRAAAAGTLAQVMRGIYFPNVNLIFDVQQNDPAGPKKKSGETGGSVTDTYSGAYSGWEVVENALSRSPTASI